MIKTWQQRCEEHPDHQQGIVTQQMIQDRMQEEIDELRQALAQPEQEPVDKYCCHKCFEKSGQVFLDRMILCPKCGNKRCPKATHHELPCTNSNEPGQHGSIYTTSPKREWQGLTDEEIQNIYMLNGQSPNSFASAIEAKLKEKNAQ